ncbi:MAG: RadC family protein [Faecalibacterium sp.]
MEEQKKNHSGHRQRMHKRVQSYGLESLAPHEALEYILYFTNARKNTNDIAHALIDRFGDFAGVLEASEEDLCTVEGVGPATARLLHLLPEIGRYYGLSRANDMRCMKDTRQLVDFLMARFSCSHFERVMLVSLDVRQRVRSAVWLCEGSDENVHLEVKDVVAAALRGGTNQVVLCHNHPNGLPIPSSDDVYTTGEIARALGMINVFLMDHIILTDTDYFSMRDENRLPLFDARSGTLIWPR